MHPLFQFVVAASLVISASCLCGILWTLNRLCGRAGSSFVGLDSNRFCCDEKGESVAGFGVFLFRDGKWQLQSDLSSPGFEVTPPMSPGRYEGQVVRREAQSRA